MARILHVLTSPRAEGTPRLVLDWLTVREHEQGVVFLKGEPADLLGDFQQTGCWLRIGNAIRPGPRKFPGIVGLARRCTAEFQPDLVIAWPTGFSHWVFLGSRLAGSRAALLSHGGNPPGRGLVARYLSTWLCLWVTALCRGRLVACSRYVQRGFREIPLVTKSTVGFSYNSVQVDAVARRADAARSRRPANAPFRAIMVATLESHKDHATLLTSAALLKERGVAIEIMLVGAGRLERSLKEMAAQLGLNGSVEFLGVRNDVPELLGQSDVFVLSTTAQEGFPGVLCEALAAGVPIVASEVEPVHELLQGGQWGTLVRAGDADALASVLAAAAKSKSSLDQGTGPGRAYICRFTPEFMICNYLSEAGLSR